MEAPMEAPAAPEQKKDPVQMMQDLGSALDQLSQGLSDGKAIPPEAAEHLMNANSEYQAFLSVVGGGEKPASQPVPAEAAGRSKAVPAGY